MSRPLRKVLKKLETPRLILRHHHKDDFDQYLEAEQSSAIDNNKASRFLAPQLFEQA